MRTFLAILVVVALFSPAFSAPVDLPALPIGGGTGSPIDTVVNLLQQLLNALREAGVPVPDVTVPTLPVTIPTIPTLPVTLPTVTVPSLPTIPAVSGLPDITVPSVTLPEITTPSISLPTV